jgi:MFS family permease
MIPDSNPQAVTVVTRHRSGVVDGGGALLSFVSSPVYGHWSDQSGRRRFVLLSAISTTLPYIALAAKLPVEVYLGLR